jgi:hypothetical protein
VGITLSRLTFSYWIDNLGFITKGKLAAIFIKPSLGVSNWPVIYFINYTPISFMAPSSPRHHRQSPRIERSRSLPNGLAYLSDNQRYLRKKEWKRGAIAAVQVEHVGAAYVRCQADPIGSTKGKSPTRKGKKKRKEGKEKKRGIT